MAETETDNPLSPGSIPEKLALLESISQDLLRRLSHRTGWRTSVLANVITTEAGKDNLDGVEMYKEQAQIHRLLAIAVKLYNSDGRKASKRDIAVQALGGVRDRDHAENTLEDALGRAASAVSAFASLNIDYFSPTIGEPCLAEICNDSFNPPVESLKTQVGKGYCMAAQRAAPTYLVALARPTEGLSRHRSNSAAVQNFPGIKEEYARMCQEAKPPIGTCIVVDRASVPAPQTSPAHNSEPAPQNSFLAVLVAWEDGYQDLDDNEKNSLFQTNLRKAFKDFRRQLPDRALTDANGEIWIPRSVLQWTAHSWYCSLGIDVFDHMRAFLGNAFGHAGYKGTIKLDVMKPMY